MCGLVPACSDAKFFQDETYESGGNRYTRPGATRVCGITINVYGQLIRFQHLVDSTRRACREADDHDKACLAGSTYSDLSERGVHALVHPWKR